MILPALPLALAAFALTLGTFGASEEPAAADSYDRPTSLIVGEWIRGTYHGAGSCPNPDDVICTYVIYDGRLSGIRTLSGPRLRSAVSIRAVTTFRPRLGQPVVMLVHQPADASVNWLGLILTTKVGDDYCLSTEQMTGFRLRPPRRSYEVGDLVCFPV